MQLGMTLSQSQVKMFIAHWVDKETNDHLEWIYCDPPGSAHHHGNNERPAIDTPGTLIASLNFYGTTLVISLDPSLKHRIRIRVFVDFWNFQLSISNLDSNFRINWQRLGRVLAEEALSVVDCSASVAYQGMNVYASYDPARKKDEPLRRWAKNTLNRFPGVDVTLMPRQRMRKGPACPSCHKEVLQCPNCQADMRGTEEKGVDTRIVTDMIKLALVDNLR